MNSIFCFVLWMSVPGAQCKLACIRCVVDVTFHVSNGFVRHLLG